MLNLACVHPPIHRLGQGGILELLSAGEHLQPSVEIVMRRRLAKRESYGLSPRLLVTVVVGGIHPSTADCAIFRLASSQAGVVIDRFFPRLKPVSKVVCLCRQEPVADHVRKFPGEQAVTSLRCFFATRGNSAPVLHLGDGGITLGQATDGLHLVAKLFVSAISLQPFTQAGSIG